MKTRIAVLMTMLLTPAAALAQDDTAALFKSKCSSCHGVTGDGKTKYGEKEKLPDMTSAEFQKGIKDAEIVDVITNGKASNPKKKGYKGKLTDEQIASLAKYVRTLKK